MPSVIASGTIRASCSGFFSDLGPYHGYSLEHVLGTKIGGSTFDSNGRRHSSADLLQHAKFSNLDIMLHAMASRILFTRSARGLFLPHISFVQIFTRSIRLQFLDRNCCVLKELLGIFWSKVFRAEITALHLWIECIYSLKNCSVILDEKYLELQELQWISVKEILKCIFLIEIISCWKNFSAFSWLKLLSAKRIRVHFIDRRYWVLRSTVLHFLDWNYCLLTE